MTASVSRAHGNADSTSTTQVNSHVNGSDSVSIASGNDTNILGGVVSGGKVSLDVGNKLNLASRQDTAESNAKQDSVGGGVTIGTNGGSGSVSISHGSANGSYANVAEQSGIKAGDGGYDINVKGNTDLKGAVIASTATPTRTSSPRGRSPGATSRTTRTTARIPSASRRAALTAPCRGNPPRGSSRAKTRAA